MTAAPPTDWWHLEPRNSWSGRKSSLREGTWKCVIDNSHDLLDDNLTLTAAWPRCSLWRWWLLTVMMMADTRHISEWTRSSSVTPGDTLQVSRVMWGVSRCLPCWKRNKYIYIKTNYLFSSIKLILWMFGDKMRKIKPFIGHQSLDCTWGTCCFRMSDYFSQLIFEVMSPVFLDHDNIVINCFQTTKMW